MCLSVVACEQAPGKDGKEIRRARKRRNSEAIGGKKFGERDTEESGRMSEAVGGKQKSASGKMSEAMSVSRCIYMVSTHSDKLCWI